MSRYFSFCKNSIRPVIRNILKTRCNETIADCLDRYKAHCSRYFYTSKVSRKQMRCLLHKLGIKTGMTLMVHASWRYFYNYEGTPQDFIADLQELLGINGTLIMPAYGSDTQFFDVDKTPSAAGVLSEVFRKQCGVIRSECSHFPVCAQGPKAKFLLSSHKYSEYGFDSFSPYAIFAQDQDSWILQLGLGKYPYKMSLVHCIEHQLRNQYPYFRDYLNRSYQATIIKDSTSYSRTMISSSVSSVLHKKNIQNIYKQLSHEHCKYSRIGALHCRLFHASSALKLIHQTVQGGLSMLKTPHANSHSFTPIDETQTNTSTRGFIR